MRRLLTISAAGVLLIGLLGPTALAESDGKKSPERSSLTLYATESSTRFISPTGTVDPPEDTPGAFAAGARSLSVDQLYSDEARTKRVGRNDISCDVTEVTGTPATGTATLLCNGVIRLAGGSLSWQASLTFDASDETPDGPFAEVAITGGTGSYRAAGGQALVFDESEQGDETLSRYEVDLLRLRARR